MDIPFQVEIAGVMYVGELDGDGEDKGEDVIAELKTSSEDISPGAPYWRRVAQVDPQVTTYLMAARAQGKKVRRVVYDVIRKTGLERFTATPLDKRKYTKATKTEPARLYANQHEHDETDDEFELRVLEDIAKTPEKYFQRHDIVRYEDEHQAHLRDVAGVVRLMQLVETMPEAPRNVNSCFKWGKCCALICRSASARIGSTTTSCTKTECGKRKKRKMSTGINGTVATPAPAQAWGAHKVISGLARFGLKAMFYGPPGSGKTSLVKGAPKPILIDYDKGANQTGIDRISGPATWTDALALIRAIAADPRGYKTIAIDTLDPLEDLATQHVCRAAGKKSLQDVGGFGAGYDALKAEWRLLLSALDVASESGMNVLLICHSVVRQTSDPQLGPYEVFTTNLQKKTWAVTP